MRSFPSELANRVPLSDVSGCDDTTEWALPTSCTRWDTQAGRLRVRIKW